MCFSYLQSEEEKRLYEGKAMEADAMAANFAAESEKKWVSYVAKFSLVNKRPNSSITIVL